MASADSNASSSATAHELSPAVRAALRYTISVREYRALHAYLGRRAPSLNKRTPAPAQYDAAVKGRDDFNAAAVRAALRTFLAAQTGLKAYDALLGIVMRRRGVAKPPPPKRALSPNTRLSISLSTLVLLHRILHRFFTRIRSNLLTSDAAPFRRRNPRVARALTSQLAPAIGASLAGGTLCAYPADQFRLTVAIYVSSRAAEFVYNALEDDGWFQDMPWLSSALLMPPALGQLLHAFLFDRDCFPAPFGNFILRFSNIYVQPRPESLPSNVAWPDVYTIVDCLGEISRLKHPPFVSPVLFPNAQDSLPASLAPIAPLITSAHPAITSMTCAVTHPSDPSCLRTFVQYWLNAFPRLVRVFAVIFSALSLFRLKALRAAPVTFLNGLAKRILKMSTFVAGSIGMGWGTICAFQNLLPRTVMPTQRWFWGGFMGGLWAFLIRNEGRSQFLYVTRQSIDSTWKVGKKHGWWRGISNGDVLVTCAGLACVSAVFDHNPAALRSGFLTKGVEFLRGEAVLKEEDHKKADSKGKEKERLE